MALTSALLASSAEATLSDETIKALIERVNRLEAENKAQAKKIAELENRIASPDGSVAVESGTSTNESGRVFTTEQGFKYYLADKSARIFEPLTAAGLGIKPYGYFAFEAVHNTAKGVSDIITDWLPPRHNKRHNGDHQTSFSVQDSILGFSLLSPESVGGWTFSGKAEFDLMGENANDYQFHWRHLYIDAAHESGWSVNIGQNWHLWKMVTPGEIDGAWLENTGHPYRRSPQIRVTKKYEGEKSAMEFRAGIVKNGPGMGGDRDGDGNEDNSASAWPLMEAAVIYERDAVWETQASSKRWLIGIGGMYGRDKSRRPTASDGSGWTDFGGESDEYDSSMVMIAGKVPFGDFTFTGQLFAGENLGGVQAGVGQRVGYVKANKRGREVGTIGGFADLSWRFSDEWRFTVGYGFDNPNDGEARYAAGRTFNDRAYINAFYDITDNFCVGFEYAHLRTDYYNERDASGDRLQFSALYQF